MILGVRKKDRVERPEIDGYALSACEDESDFFVSGSKQNEQKSTLFCSPNAVNLLYF